ncbi:MAG: aspartate kinase [Candidatus Kapabacteria bacterium]|nr:aspartate kinase [Candidatus Kapabacteria bacterium]
MKFGGSSVKDATALRRVASIVANSIQEQGGTVVVLSATAGTTDDLITLARSAARAENCTSIIERIADRHRAILSELAPTVLHTKLDEVLSEFRSYVNALSVLGECTDQSLDHVTAFGERLSTTILHTALVDAGLPSTYFDVRRVMRTDDAFCAARVEMSDTLTLVGGLLAPLCTTGQVIVTQGFIGSTKDGLTTTLGRGGSDYTCAILGSMLCSREIQIWTDVSGVYSADPRIAGDAQPITELSFSEVREMALFGAKVLHPDTIAPAVEAEIPVVVLNTFHPEDHGTRIVGLASSGAEIHAVSIVRSCSLVRCNSLIADQLRSTHVINKAIILESKSIESSMIVVHTSTSESALALEVALVDTGLIVNRVVLLAVTGPKVMHQHVMSNIVESLAPYNVFCISSGSAEHTIFATVAEEQGNEALRSIHDLIRHHH